MTLFPLSLNELLGPIGAYAVYLAIGFFFGYVLEISGFGNSKKLAAQFYFKDLTVLKVMFTAIIVAMVGIFLATSLGLLDYNMVWVNPTYLWPGIVGGLIMGVGFIVGGFCPGTSLVAAATAKLDGIFFVLGVLFGIFVFGETVSLFEDFFYSSYMGRFTLMELFNTSTGIIVLGVVLMALFMFWGSEKLEGIFGGLSAKTAPRWRYGAAAAIVVVSLGVMGMGQPTNADRWHIIYGEKQAQLDGREVQIHPGELLSLRDDPRIRLVLLDVRSEADFNLFHLMDAVNLPLGEVLGAAPDLLAEPTNSVFVLMSNDETAATEAWKLLVAEQVVNVYILEGGINNWIDTFVEGGPGITPLASMSGEDMLVYGFGAAYGHNHPAAFPEAKHFNLEFTPKVKLQIKQGPTSGGCG
jgi:hypothetical protein